MVFIIKPVSAQLTKDKDWIGKSDPYCVVIIGQQKQRTKTHQGGGKKPQWYDTLQFQSNGNMMKVQVYDDDWGKDDFIGQATVNLNQLTSNPMRTENQYVDLVCNGKSAGRVLISMQYQGQPMGGNQGGWGNQNSNQGWGNGPSNQGWGNQPNQGGWGNQPNNTNQGGWGNQPNNQGWGNQPNQGGWGNQPNNQGGWGNQPNNQGWGNQPNNQGGWGNQPNNQGWGNQPNQGGWGNQPNNQGWGNQPNNQGLGPNKGW